MAKDIDCVKKILEKVFDLRYRVPDYQRPYVWESENVEALLTDTLEAYKENKNSQYFLGAIVLKTISEDEFEILDGQQRLTTIFLTLAVIRDISDDEKLIKKVARLSFKRKIHFLKSQSVCALSLTYATTYEALLTNTSRTMELLESSMNSNLSQRIKQWTFPFVICQRQ